MAFRGKESENGVYEFPYVKPPEQSRWEAVKTALYDPKNGTVFGRTGKSWAQILVFYCIFYICLAALFAICVQAMLSTIDEKAPKWQQDNGLIGNNPGLGFRPISNKTEEGSLIWYDSKNATSIKKWVELTEKFLEPYLDENLGKNQVACSFGKRPGAGQVCDVDMKSFGPCGPDKDYGFNSSSPCVFLKLNRIYGWMPEYYNNPEDLPQEMPELLKEKIRTSKEGRDQIWISCEGENPADREFATKFELYPTWGFPSYYYPFTNDAGYLSPLVAVQIVSPKPNVLINIECRAWAKNINYRGGNQQREGSVHFEIMRDS